jgi:hypothetical protein
MKNNLMGWHENVEGQTWIYRRKKKGKKKKDVGDASEVWQLLASYKKKEKAEMNQMTWWNNIFYHQN